MSSSSYSAMIGTPLFSMSDVSMITRPLRRLLAPSRLITQIEPSSETLTSFIVRASTCTRSVTLSLGWTWVKCRPSGAQRTLRRSLANVDEPQMFSTESSGTCATAGATTAKHTPMNATCNCLMAFSVV